MTVLSLKLYCILHLCALLSSSHCGRALYCVFCQSEVMHDYKENRVCLAYTLEGDDSPDLQKREGGGRLNGHDPR